MCGVILFCRQKTADEMRISDWSSDVCSSDLFSSGAGSKATRLTVTEVTTAGFGSGCTGATGMGAPELAAETASGASAVSDTDAVSGTAAVSTTYAETAVAAGASGTAGAGTSTGLRVAAGSTGEVIAARQEEHTS